MHSPNRHCVGRREFLMAVGGGFLTFAGVLPAVRSWAGQQGSLPLLHRPQHSDDLTEFERLHVPRVRMPEMIEDGANTPCFIEMDHPMEPEHYITRVHIYDYEDPIIWKGTWHFTPNSGQVYVYTQLRLDSGKSTVYAVAECNRHGQWVGSANINVAVGGC